jgi:uncharacterized protein
MNADDVQTYCDGVIQDMRVWLERAVIGLNLCPFAKGVHAKGQIRYVVSLAADQVAVLEALKDELQKLIAADANIVDTSLLILPRGFEDFFEFNTFLKKVERLVSRMKLEGIIQVASFHPQFQFAGTDAEDITNFSNRAPYPTLHLLREASIDRAVESFPQAELIFGKNMETLAALGHAGWARLGVAATTGTLNFDQAADKLSEVSKP